MARPLPGLHHVVFVISPENLDRAAEFLAEIGFEFVAFEHAELHLQIRLDWDRGFELIAPTPNAPSGSGTAADFLARHGEGLFSVVVRIPDADSAERTAERHGTKADFRQYVGGDGTDLTEVKLEPLWGIPLTLLETNLP